MSALDKSSSINEVATSSKKVPPKLKEEHSSEISAKTVTSLIEQLKSQVKDFALTTFSPLLVIVRVTVIFIFALLADTLIILMISWCFGGIVSRYPFAATLLEGIQLLSALGTALAYILYLIRSLFKDAKHFVEEIREESSREEAQP